MSVTAGVSNHKPRDCLLNRLLRLRSKKTSKLRVTGLCAGNSPVTGEFPAQRASNAENVSIWWRHHETSLSSSLPFRCMRGQIAMISILLSSENNASNITMHANSKIDFHLKFCYIHSHRKSAMGLVLIILNDLKSPWRIRDFCPPNRHHKWMITFSSSKISNVCVLLNCHAT